MAQALGFQVTSLRCPSPPLSTLVSSFCPQASILTAQPWRTTNLPEVIFLYLALLPWDAGPYWASWLMPHVFFALAGITDKEE